jgi:hemerythrin-like domain-containing protein
VRVAGPARGGTLTAEQRGAFDNALRYFREAAPKHTADEEQSLFPRLRQTHDEGTTALLARVEWLEEDHGIADQIHAEVDRIGQAWLANGELMPDDATRLITILAQFREMYRHHIAAEDNEVFPAAAAILSGEDRVAIGKEMAFRRGDPASTQPAPHSSNDASNAINRPLTMRPNHKSSDSTAASFASEVISASSFSG